MSNQSQDTVTVILAIAAAVFPILFGFLLWKLSQIFVTDREFREYKSQIANERIELQLKLTQIDKNLIELLERTADRRR